MPKTHGSKHQYTHSGLNNNSDSDSDSESDSDSDSDMYTRDDEDDFLLQSQHDLNRCSYLLSAGRNGQNDSDHKHGHAEDICGRNQDHVCKAVHKWRDHHGIHRDHHGIHRDHHGIHRDHHGIHRDHHGIGAACVDHEVQKSASWDGLRIHGSDGERNIHEQRNSDGAYHARKHEQRQSDGAHHARKHDLDVYRTQGHVIYAKSLGVIQSRDVLMNPRDLITPPCDLITSPRDAAEVFGRSV
jgi:hypothetical protein